MPLDWLHNYVFVSARTIKRHHHQNRSDNVFRFKLAAFYMGLKSKVGLVAAKVLVLWITLTIHDCSVVAPSLHVPSHAPLLLPLLLSHNIPLPRVH
jgi:hypothetical protein